MPRRKDWKQTNRDHDGARTRSKTDRWGEPPWTARFVPKAKPFPERVDVAIIGGGFSGLSAAAHLKRMAPEKSVLVLEAGQLGNGASGRTGGMALDETAAGKMRNLGNVLRGYRQILRALNVEADAIFPGVWEIGRGGAARCADESPEIQKALRDSLE